MPAKDQGVFEDRYKIIPRVLVFATHRDSILLLKGSPQKRLWANLYNGIGGHVEKGEDVLSAARREFCEETTQELIGLWLCAIITIDTEENIGIGMYVFRGEVSSIESKSSSEGPLEWIPVEKIKSLPLVEDLPILVSKILAMKKTDPPLFLHYYYNKNNDLIIRSWDETHENLIEIESLLR